MASALAEKTCTPCRGGVPPLTPEEAEGYRARETPEWALLDGAARIERTYRFRDFRAAFGFVARAADLAEAKGHHPDVGFGWGYATASLRTKKIRGLHENDFIMAAKLDRLASGAGESPQGQQGDGERIVDRSDETGQPWSDRHQPIGSPRGTHTQPDQGQRKDRPNAPDTDTRR
jgi:4a-hydroxytetrahydrobiopterin dehydratase